MEWNTCTSFMSIGLAIYLQHEDYINFCFLESKTTRFVVIVRSHYFREVLINHPLQSLEQ